MTLTSAIDLPPETMDDAPPQEHPEPADGGPQQCVWTCHPLREEPPLKSIALIAAIVGSAAVMTVSLGNPVYGAISVVVLALATMDYFLPTRYVIDADGAAWKQLVWRRRRWTTFRRFVRHADGIFLSPFRHQSRLDSFRGVFLRFGDGVCADDVDALVKLHVAD
ncbi:MAG: hypothetical protein VCE12_14305 [Candidatus Latescibacterota bacterium]